MCVYVIVHVYVCVCVCLCVCVCVCVSHAHKKEMESNLFYNILMIQSRPVGGVSVPQLAGHSTAGVQGPGSPGSQPAPPSPSQGVADSLHEMHAEWLKVQS